MSLLRSKKLLSYEKKYFKRNKWLLTKKYKDLQTEDKLALNVTLSHSNELSDAWVLKKLFLNVLESKTKKEGKELLKKWLKTAEDNRLK